MRAQRASLAGSALAVLLLAYGAIRFLKSGFLPATVALGGDFGAVFPSPLFARLRPDFPTDTAWVGGWYSGPMVHFLTLPLFLVPRWWKSADPGRRHRLELWSTAAVVFWAWLVGMFWEFPQPWGLMVAAGSCVALQLASPWVDPRTRRQAA